MPVVNLGNVEVKKYELLPAGSYVMEVTDAELVTAKSGNEMVKVTLQPSKDIDGPRGAVFDQFVLVDASYGFLKAFLLALGMTNEEMQELNIDNEWVADLIGREVGAKVGIKRQDGYDDKNTVRSYFGL